MMISIVKHLLIDVQNERRKTITEENKNPLFTIDYKCHRGIFMIQSSSVSNGM